MSFLSLGEVVELTIGLSDRFRVSSFFFYVGQTCSRDSALEFGTRNSWTELGFRMAAALGIVKKDAFEVMAVLEVYLLCCWRIAPVGRTSVS